MVLDWTNDPMVRIEEILNPFLIGTALSLAEPRPSYTMLAESCGAPEDLFRQFGREVIEDFGFGFAAHELATINHAMEEVRSFRAACERADADRDQLIGQFRSDLRPAAEDALNVFRAVFIGGIIQVQANQTHNAKEAVTELSRISRQIHFVAVNASIEAARVGEAGKGFAVIGTEMRRLAQTATETTKRLQGVIDQGPAADPDTIQNERATGTGG